MDTGPHNDKVVLTVGGEVDEFVFGFAVGNDHPSRDLGTHLPAKFGLFVDDFVPDLTRFK